MYSIRKIVVFLRPSIMAPTTGVQHVTPSIHIALLSYNLLICRNE
jgi:hypothetical protein